MASGATALMRIAAGSQFTLSRWGRRMQESSNSAVTTGPAPRRCRFSNCAGYRSDSPAWSLSMTSHSTFGRRGPCARRWRTAPGSRRWSRSCQESTSPTRERSPRRQTGHAAGSPRGAAARYQHRPSRAQSRASPRRGPQHVSRSRADARRGVIDWPALYRARRAARGARHGVRPHRQVRRLGVALQQMTEIAKALVAKARVLILDEPTAAITAEEADQLFGIVASLRARAPRSSSFPPSRRRRPRRRPGHDPAGRQTGRDPADGGDDAAS